jgi:hypothetical protein
MRLQVWKVYECDENECGSRSPSDPGRYAADRWSVYRQGRESHYPEKDPFGAFLTQRRGIRLFMQPGIFYLLVDQLLQSFLMDARTDDVHEFPALGCRRLPVLMPQEQIFKSVKGCVHIILDT